MRLNKSFIATLLAISALSLQSCLKNQEDIFPESSSERLQAVLDNTKAVLTSSPDGWVFDYTPDRYQSYGSFIYTVKFDEQQVSVGCELAPGVFEKSLYKLTDDNGPMLSFDSYNSLMHYYATPWGDKDGYQAQDGDFEFMIMDVTEDLIKLRGKRTGNTMYLRRLNEDPAAFINSVSAMNDNIYVSGATGTVGETTVSGSIDLDVRYMELNYSDGQTAGAFFLPTATGIRFVEPLVVNGSAITELNYEIDGYLFTGQTTDGKNVSITGILPETYTFIEEFDGAFTLGYFFGIYNVNITLVPDPASGTITVKTENFDIRGTYNKTKGCLSIMGQTLYSDSSMSVFLYGALASGSFYTTSSAGMDFVRDEKDPNLFNASGAKESADVTGLFLVATYAGEDGYWLSPAPWKINGTSQLSYVSNIKRKK